MRAFPLLAALMLGPGCDKLACDGCDDTATDTDTDTDTDADTDTDVGNPCLSDVDTSLCLLFVSGDIQTSAGSFIGGHVEFAVVKVPVDLVVCSHAYEWHETGVPAPACPQCEWAFNLTLANGVAAGDWCGWWADLDGSAEGSTASWGFAERYEYDYNGTIYPLELALLYYSPGYGWEPFSYNYGSYGYSAGDADRFSFRSFAETYPF